MRSQAAFTLVEIVLALGVAALAIVGIMALLPAGLDSGRAAQTDTVAANLAQWIFEEEFLGRGYDAVESEYAGKKLPRRLLPDDSKFPAHEDYDPDNCEVLLVGYRSPVSGLDLREVTLAVGTPLYQPRDGLWDLEQKERDDLEIPRARRTWATYTTYLSKRTNS